MIITLSTLEIILYSTSIILGLSYLGRLLYKRGIRNGTDEANRVGIANVIEQIINTGEFFMGPEERIVGKYQQVAKQWNDVVAAPVAGQLPKSPNAEPETYNDNGEPMAPVGFKGNEK